jgi:hypothetical protein
MRENTGRKRRRYGEKEEHAGKYREKPVAEIKRAQQSAWNSSDRGPMESDDAE